MSDLDHLYLTGIIAHAGEYSPEQIEEAALSLVGDDPAAAVTYLAESLHAQALDTIYWRGLAQRQTMTEAKP